MRPPKKKKSDDMNDMNAMNDSSELHWFETGQGNYSIREPQRRVTKLPAGAYECGFGMMGPWINGMDLKNEELVRFNNGPMVQVMDEIRQFWSMRERYDQLGLIHRRGIMLYGRPGTGKSGLVKMICDEIINEDGLVIYGPTPEHMAKWMPMLNKAEPDRKVVIVYEDLDELVNYNQYEFLQLLDGIGTSRPGLVFVATTNFIENIPGRILRPSRFDLLVEVDYPTTDVRREYVASLCNRFGVGMREDIVDATEGMSFASTKEMLTSCLLYERPVEEVKARLEKHAELSDDDEEDD